MDEEERTSGAGTPIAPLVENYAAQLYHYCATLLSDRDAAARAVSNALLAGADRIGDLADPHKLELWLMALARNECLRIDRANREDGDAVDPLREDRVLREVAELIHAHALDHRGVAAVLGTSVRRARTLALKAETAVLERRVMPTRGGLTPLPDDLPARVLAEAESAGRTVYRGEVARPLRRSGFPVPLDQPNQRRRMLLLAGVAAGLVVVGVVHAVPFGDNADRDVVLSVGEPDQPLELPPVTDPASPSGSASTSPSASKSPSPSASPSRSTSTSPTAAPRKPQPPAPSAPNPPPRRAPVEPSGQITGIFGDCLDAGAGVVELRRCDGGADQRWTVGFDGTLRALGGCIQAEGGGTAKGTRVVLAGCNGSDTQQWFEGASGSVRNGRSGTCMDGPNNRDNPVTVEIWHCTGGEYQRWSLPS